MRTLVIPPAARRDDDSIQMLSAWIAENGLHCTMNVGMWHGQGQREARAWGILLAGVIRHLANAIEKQQGLPRDATAAEILQCLHEEFEDPTSGADGGFHPGHS
jgi:hypothetical protein